jgi:hypothetical protein
MGALRMGPPFDIVLALKDAIGLRCFFETGTYLGDTTARAARHFARVVTVERAEAFHRRARERFAGSRTIECRLGESREWIARLLPELPPSLFWLDAHWSGGETAGEGEECPVLREIALLAPAADRHVILIDDARLFLAPPPAPHCPEQWPTIGEITAALAANHRPYVTVFEDVIVAVPARLRERMVALLRDRPPGGHPGDRERGLIRSLLRPDTVALAAGDEAEAWAEAVLDRWPQARAQALADQDLAALAEYCGSHAIGAVGFVRARGSVGAAALTGAAPLLRQARIDVLSCHAIATATLAAEIHATLVAAGYRLYAIAQEGLVALPSLPAGAVHDALVALHPRVLEAIGRRQAGNP